MPDTFINDIQQTFSQNFKQLLKKEKLTQKQLAEKMGVLESTVSNCNRKLPTCEFLLKLKAIFPDISLDELLMGEISSVKTPVVNHSNDTDNHFFKNNDYEKFIGAYYFYYLNTSSKNDASYSSKLSVGVIYIYKDPAFIYPSQEGLTCLALFGLKNRKDAEDIKTTVETLPANNVLEYFKSNYFYNLYIGSLEISQSHIFIYLKQEHNNKDRALIILHYTESNSPQYIGGLGTVNSASSGRPSDPVVQLIGLSREKVYLTDEEMQKYLRFPKTASDSQHNYKELLDIIKNLYDKKNALPASEKVTDESVFFQKYIPNLIESQLNKLLDEHLEKNLLLYGKASNSADDDWYHVIRTSKTIYTKGAE